MSYNLSLKTRVTGKHPVNFIGRGRVRVGTDSQIGKRELLGDLNYGGNSSICLGEERRMPPALGRDS